MDENINNTICRICNETIEHRSIMYTDMGTYFHTTCLDKIVDAVLVTKYKHGHPSFLTFSMDEIDLHNRKNHDYATGGDPLGNFNRVNTILDKIYPGFKENSGNIGIAMIYALKQLDCILWSIAQGTELKTEGLHDRFRDVSVYMRLCRCMLTDEERNHANTKS